MIQSITLPGVETQAILQWFYHPPEAPRLPVLKDNTLEHVFQNIKAPRITC